jgi:hypothetical protein
MGFRFELYRRSDFGKPPGVEGATQRLLVRRGISLVYGEPKTGKSLLMQSVACVAAADYDDEADRLWCGYPVSKMKILYVAAEGFPGLMSRHDCFEEINGVAINDDNFRYLRRPINYFINDSDWKEAAQDLKAQGFCPDYIFTDTLARSVLGSDERSEKDMAKVFTNAKGFCCELNRAGMCFIGHATKDGRNYRGSPAIFAMVDGLSEVTRNGLAITWTCKDFKDAEPFEPVTVRCESAEVDTEMGPQKVIQIKTAAPGLAAQRSAKEDKDLDFMERVLALNLGNQAAYKQWFAEMIRVMPQKVDKATGEMKPGIGETTFRRWLKKIAKRGHIILPPNDELTSQGYIYSIVAGPWAIQPETVAFNMDGSTATNHRHFHSLKGMEINGGGFGDGQAPPNHSHQESGGGTIQGRTEGQGSPVDEELARLKKQIG